MEKPRYSSESSHEDEEGLLSHTQKELTPPPRSSKWLHCGLAFCFVLGMVTAIIIMTVFFNPQTEAQPADDSGGPPYNRKLPFSPEGSDPNGTPASWHNGDCGNSVADAQAQGCKFDIVLHAWLPPACITAEDDADAEEIYAMEDWQWGTTSHLNESAVSIDQIRTGTYEFLWTSTEWHLAHCTFVWRRLHRAILDGRMIDSYTSNYHHTKHCQHMLLAAKTGEKLPSTKIFAKYPTCA